MAGPSGFDNSGMNILLVDRTASNPSDPSMTPAGPSLARLPYADESDTLSSPARATQTDASVPVAALVVFAFALLLVSHRIGIKGVTV